MTAGPPTLAELARGGLDLSTWCPACGTSGETLRPEALIARLGPGFLAIDVGPRLVCSRCGGKGGEIRVCHRTLRMGLR